MVATSETTSNGVGPVAVDGRPEHATAREGTMKAIVQDKYGSADVLELGTSTSPRPKTMRCSSARAAGVERGVWHLMTGLAYPIRLAGYGLRRPKNPVRGREVAGRVEAIGKNVTRFRPGDEVMGIGEGSFAEYVRAREDKLALKPANLTFEQAAVVPSPHPPLFRLCATKDGFSRDSRCWSSARLAAWGRSLFSWPKPARSSPAWPALPRWT